MFLILQSIFENDAVVILASGDVLSATDFAVSAPAGREWELVDSAKITWGRSPDSAAALFWIADLVKSKTVTCSAFVRLSPDGVWRLTHVHKSSSAAGAQK